MEPSKPAKRVLTAEEIDEVLRPIREEKAVAKAQWDAVTGELVDALCAGSLRSYLRSPTTKCIQEALPFSYWQDNAQVRFIACTMSRHEPGSRRASSDDWKVFVDEVSLAALIDPVSVKKDKDQAAFLAALAERGITTIADLERLLHPGPVSVSTGGDIAKDDFRSRMDAIAERSRADIAAIIAAPPRSFPREGMTFAVSSDGAPIHLKPKAEAKPKSGPKRDGPLRGPSRDKSDPFAVWAKAKWPAGIPPKRDGKFTLQWLVDQFGAQEDRKITISTVRKLFKDGILTIAEPDDGGVDSL